MDIDQLRAFVAVARAGRFTRAAKQTGVTQPNLTRRIQKLERKLRTKLVIRGPQSVTLTVAGERFLLHAERALAAFDSGIGELEDLEGKPRGVVSLGAMPTIGTCVLPSILARFRKQYPDVVLRLSQRLPYELEERVARGEIDLAVINLPAHRADLIVQKLWRENYVLAVPRSHVLASHRGPISLAKVAGEPLLVIPGVPATLALKAACENSGVQPLISIEADDLDIIQRMVEHGLGVALVPGIVANSGVATRFRTLAIAEDGLTRQIGLIHRGEGYLTYAARALRDTVVKAMRAARM